MTALNIIQTHDAIHFFSDGAHINPLSGHVVEISQKVFAYPLARCVIGTSGPSILGKHLGMVGQYCATIDQVLVDIEALLPEWIKVFLGIHPGMSGIGVSVYVGGFSSNGERQLFKVVAKLTDTEFKFIRCDADCWQYEPQLTPHTLRLAVGNEKGDEFDRGFIDRLTIADPIAHGMLAMEAQRRLKVSDVLFPGGSLHTVGAFAQVTTVTRDKVESRILKRWPDQCGAPINPDGAAKVYQLGFGKVAYQPQPAVAFKGSNDAANAINTGQSSNYSVNNSVGYVAPTNLTTDTFSQSLTSNNPNFTGYAVRQFIPSSSLSIDGSRIQVTLTGPSSGAALVLSSVYIGHVGTAPNFDGNQVQLTFSGNTGVTVPVGGSVTSDVVDLAFDHTKDVIVSMGVTSGDFRYNSSATGLSKYQKASSAGESGNTSVSGYTQVSNTLSAVTKISALSPNDMTFEIVAQTADASVETARVLLKYDATDNPTLNTDLTVEVTCNGGTNWATATLTLATAYGQDGHYIADTGWTECTAGTSVAARVKTLNNTYVPVHGLTLAWQ